MKTNTTQNRKKTTGIIRIGTSNITLPGNKQSFPAAFRDKSRLNYYSHLFNTLEVNSSFYKVPMLSTFQKWSQDVPENFQFTIKLWQDITHIKGLDFKQDSIQKFMVAADGIGIKKGCILVQFPGKISLDYFKKAENILQELSNSDVKNSWRKAIEFRNTTWDTAETLELMDEYGASLVLHDKFKNKIVAPNKGADFIYLRFHGPRGDYKESYSDEFLNSTAATIIKWLKDGKDVYAYFNNTIGSAFENAVSLKEKVERSKKTAAW